MTPPITPMTVPLVLVDDPTLVGALVTVGTAESDAVSAFVVNVVVNPAVVDMSAEGHEFLPQWSFFGYRIGRKLEPMERYRCKLNNVNHAYNIVHNLVATVYLM